MSEWISVKDKSPDVFAGIFKVKRSNRDETKAYYYSDRAAYIAFYGWKTTDWWDYSSKEPIYDVTHWMSLPLPPKD